MVEEAEFEAEELKLGSRDRILLYTDGAVEILVGEEDRLGTAGLAELLSSFPPQGRNHRLTVIYEELMRRCARPEVEDDITLLSCIVA